MGRASPKTEGHERAGEQRSAEMLNCTLSTFAPDTRQSCVDLSYLSAQCKHRLFKVVCQAVVAFD